jgi:hypothetical protein
MPKLYVHNVSRVALFLTVPRKTEFRQRDGLKVQDEFMEKQIICLFLHVPTIATHATKSYIPMIPKFCFTFQPKFNRHSFLYLLIKVVSNYLFFVACNRHYNALLGQLLLEILLEKLTS